ncbi:TLDc domain-containing protein [Entamoeba marina]
MNESNDFEYDLTHYGEIPEGTNEEVKVKYEVRLKELNQQILNRKEVIENKEEMCGEIKKWIKSINYALVNDGIESYVSSYELQHGYYTVCSKFLINNQRITWMNSINLLKEWSGKQHYTILFDSNIDGNGLYDVLQHKIFNKSNLYFIHFDDFQNIFGGFISTVIDDVDTFITDPNAFTFSLVRNGINKNMKYSINKNKQEEAFILSCQYDWLYSFGHINYQRGDDTYVDGDIFVSPILRQNSSCYSSTYCYNGEEEPLVNNTQDEFEIKRILVLQMS